MKVHLFGLPKSAHIRLKEESDQWRNAVPVPHEFRSTPILSNELGRINNSEVEELARAIGEGFNHIVLAGVREWQKIYARLLYDGRIHIARLKEPIRDLPWPALQATLHAVVSLDEEWLRKLSPGDLKHPLILPPSVFATNRETEDYWRHCDVYSRDRFGSAEQVLEGVRRHHLRPDLQGNRSWLDSRNRRYRIDPSRHGRSDADRVGLKSYRFCSEIPPGFHYDVTDDAGRTFAIEIDGRIEKLTHCNVTPWGKIRRG